MPKVKPLGLAELLSEQDHTFNQPKEEETHEPQEDVQEVVDEPEPQADEEDSQEDGQEEGDPEQLQEELSEEEREAKALESEEFSPAAEEVETEEEEIFESFSPEDYSKKEKIPLIRQDNRRLSKLNKEYEKKEIEWNQEKESKEEKIKSLEEELQRQSIPAADYTKDPEYLEIAANQDKKFNALTASLSKVRGASDFSVESWKSIYAEYVDFDGDIQGQNDFVLEKALSLMGKGDIVQENTDENGVIDVDGVYDSLSSRERQLVPNIESSLEGALSQFHQAFPKVEQIKRRIEEDSSTYNQEQKISQYKENINSFSESMKGVGILSEQALEIEGISYHGFIHELASNPENKQRIDTALDALSQYKYGAKPISPQLYEWYENQDGTKSKSRKQVDKLQQEKHQQRVGRLDKEIATFLAFKDDIYDIVSKYASYKSKEDARKQERKKVSTAERVHTKKSSGGLKGDNPVTLAELIGAEER